jgi:hypothetical protein
MNLRGVFSGTDFAGCGKNDLFCHSERSEESLFDLSIRKETKRDSSLRSECQRFEFFRSQFSLWLFVPARSKPSVLRVKSLCHCFLKFMHRLEKMRQQRQNDH